MHPPSPAIAAAVRAIGGESNLDAVMPALDDAGLAHVIACAPETHHLVRAVAAICGGLTGLLDSPTVADPTLHAAMARMIGTRTGRHALCVWAHVAPAAWGRSYAEALIVEARFDTCDAAAAAALIGPCDESAGLLHDPEDAAFAIRRWGQADPAAPTAWADTLTPAERDRLIATVQRDSFSAASCLPWLPPDGATRMRFADEDLGAALTAFAAASPSARTRHAARLRRLVDRARPKHLDDLTRLACAMRSDAVWRRVQTLIRESPDDVRRVVAAAPWHDLPDDVRADILERADPSDVCAAVAAARGQRDPVAMDITGESAAAFFAALDPRVWDALDAAGQRRWRHALPGGVVHLAVRSLGLRPEFLARALLNGDLAIDVRQHARNEAALRTALFPVALRRLPPADAHALIAAMPTPPPDPGEFFVIASGHADPDVLAPAGSALRTPADLACAVALQRSRDAGVAIRAHCAVLQHALHGRSHDDLAPIRALLSDDARTMLMPDADTLVARLAHPDRRDALRRTLDRLATLPPEVAIPTRVALTRWTPQNASSGAAAIADALHAHGDVLLELADALADVRMRAAVLPLPDDPTLARALRGLVKDDPPSAIHMAQALRGRSWRAALLTLLTAPQTHAGAVWQALDNAARRAIGAVVVVAPSDAEPLAVTPSPRLRWRRGVTATPICATRAARRSRRAAPASGRSGTICRRRCSRCSARFPRSPICRRSGKPAPSGADPAGEGGIVHAGWRRS